MYVFEEYGAFKGFDQFIDVCSSYQLTSKVTLNSGLNCDTLLIINRLDPIA